jgi:hypothetical protein
VGSWTLTPSIYRLSPRIKADPINPASWRGIKVDIASVNLRTCWVLGYQRAVEHVPEAAEALDRLSNTPGIDILSPLGDVLVRLQDPDYKFDCSELSSTYSYDTQPTELRTVEAPTPVS